MYYKIINKECEVYKNLHEMRTNELQIEKENKLKIEEIAGSSFVGFLGYGGQQNFRRVPLYVGFNFTEPEKIDHNVWRLDPENENIYIPNKKTKKGREIAELLNNGLKSSIYTRPMRLLGVEIPIRCTFPFVTICGDVILLFIDDKCGEPTDENVIEITSKEFKSYS